MATMSKTIIKALSHLSRFFNLDVLWRLINNLQKEDRLTLIWRLLKQDAEEVTFERDGILWTGKTWDSLIMMNLFYHGSYQLAELEKVLEWMQRQKRFAGDNRVIIDAGANIGTSSIYFAAKTICNVLAIEPIPENFALLQRNVKQNNFSKRINCVEKVVSREKGRVEMILPEGNCGAAFVDTTNGQANGRGSHESAIREKFSVNADTLKNIMASSNIMPEQVAFVWSDTEGSESEVIISGAQLWQVGVPLYVELHPYALKCQNQLDSFVGLVAEYFDEFILSEDLIKHGYASRPTPISQIVEVLDKLYLNNDVSDALLLPKKFKCP